MKYRLPESGLAGNRWRSVEGIKITGQSVDKRLLRKCCQVAHYIRGPIRNSVWISRRYFGATEAAITSAQNCRSQGTISLSVVLVRNFSFSNNQRSDPRPLIGHIRYRAWFACTVRCSDRSGLGLDGLPGPAAVFELSRCRYRDVPPPEPRVEWNNCHNRHGFKILLIDESQEQSSPWGSWPMPMPSAQSMVSLSV